MSECTHNCETCGQNCSERQSKPEDFLEKPNSLSYIKKVVDPGQLGLPYGEMEGVEEAGLAFDILRGPADGQAIRLCLQCNLAVRLHGTEPLVIVDKQVAA